MKLLERTFWLALFPALMVLCLCGGASAQSSTNPAPITPEIQREKAVIAGKIQHAKLLYEKGNFDDAEAILVEILKADPDNKSAAYYLALVKDARVAARARAAAYGPGLHNIPNGRRGILTKLNTIRLAETGYDLPLIEVINKLLVESRKRDPGGVGINFMIINPHPGESAGDPNQITIKIDPPLRDLRLIDVLDAITKAASSPIRYSIEDYAVVFSLKSAKEAGLYTKIFKVDPSTFVQGLENVRSINFSPGAQNGGTGGTGVQIPGVQTAPLAPGGQTGLTFVTRTNNTAHEDELVRAYFTAAGVDLTVPGKAVFFNDRLGELLVHASPNDLEIIEQSVGLLNQPTPAKP
jgi:hypothetical protein